MKKLIINVRSTGKKSGEFLDNKIFGLEMPDTFTLENDNAFDEVFKNLFADYGEFFPEDVNAEIVDWYFD